MPRINREICSMVLHLRSLVLVGVCESGLNGGEPPVLWYAFRAVFMPSHTCLPVVNVGRWVGETRRVLDVKVGCPGN